MIYSPDHNFLLLKNRKVGGSSLEIVLSKVLPDNAIVTKLNNHGNTWDVIPEDHKERNYKDYFYNHIKYEEVKKKIDLTNVKSYVFVRNPYNAVLSAFFHRLNSSSIWNASPNPNSWSALLENERDEWVDQYFAGTLGNLPWYKSDKYIFLDKNGNQAVDKILYYEKGIEEEINPILKLHGISTISLNVHHLKHRPEKIVYKDVFKKRHLSQIRKEWAWEFENLNYLP